MNRPSGAFAYSLSQLKEVNFMGEGKHVDVDEEVEDDWEYVDDPTELSSLGDEKRLPGTYANWWKMKRHVDLRSWKK